MISTSDNLFGVKSDKSVRSDGEDELEGFVGVRRVDEEGRFARGEGGNKKEQPNDKSFKHLNRIIHVRNHMDLIRKVDGDDDS